jgi:hypothetical protein
VDMESKKGLLERELQLVGGGLMEKDRKGESEDEKDRWVKGSQDGEESGNM